MKGIKNYGYNIIELVNSVITESDENFAQVITDGDTFTLTNGETDLSNHLIHCNYDVDELSNFLGNGKFANVIFNYTVGTLSSSANLHSNEFWYDENDNHINKFYVNTGIMHFGGLNIVIQFSLGVRYNTDAQKYESDIEIRIPTTE